MTIAVLSSVRVRLSLTLVATAVMFSFAAKAAAEPLLIRVIEREKIVDLYKDQGFVLEKGTDGLLMLAPGVDAADLVEFVRETNELRRSWYRESATRGGELDVELLRKNANENGAQRNVRDERRWAKLTEAAEIKLVDRGGHTLHLLRGLASAFLRQGGVNSLVERQRQDGGIAEFLIQVKEGDGGVLIREVRENKKLPALKASSRMEVMLQVTANAPGDPESIGQHAFGIVAHSAAPVSEIGTKQVIQLLKFGQVVLKEQIYRLVANDAATAGELEPMIGKLGIDKRRLPVIGADQFERDLQVLPFPDAFKSYQKVLRVTGPNLPISGVRPTPLTVENGLYPYVFTIVTRMHGQPSLELMAFRAFLGSEAGKAEVIKLGWGKAP